MRKNHSRIHLIFIILSATMVSIAIMGYLLWASYQDTLKTAGINTRNMAWMVESRLDATLRRAETVLNELASSRLEQRSTSPKALTIKQLNANMDQRMAQFPELAGLRIFGADGALVASSGFETAASSGPVHAGKRDFFLRMKGEPGLRFDYSDVFEARSIGRPAIVMIRSIRTPEGKFLGIATAVLNLDFYQKILASLEMGPQGSITIRRSDTLKLIVRQPPLLSEINKAVPPDTPVTRRVLGGELEATIDFTPLTDGIRRISSFRRLQNYPFFVLVGIAHDDVMAIWYERLKGISLLSAIILLVLAVLILRLWRTQAREAAALAELAANEHRLSERTLELQRVNEQLAQLCITDGLTGLNNRRRFDEALEAEFQRARRSGLPLSVLMMDIDYFKSFNDTHGHVAGDDCLRRVGRLIGDIGNRVPDMAARYGGEEFAVILPETDATGAQLLAERVREGVEALAIAHGASSVGPYVTVSIGRATIFPAAPALFPASARDIVRLADQALYQAKNYGRNQVCTVPGAEALLAPA